MDTTSADPSGEFIQHSKESLESEIVKGLHSGHSILMTEQDWRELRAEIASRHSSTNDT
jgi:hypothetical protein